MKKIWLLACCFLLVSCGSVSVDDYAAEQPVLNLESFRDEAEAVARANATRFGLSASVWTHDGARARRVARALRSGTVWINTHNKLLPEAETGGFGASGYGRLHGAEAMLEFLETKHVYEDIGRVKPRTEPT